MNSLDILNLPRELKDVAATGNMYELFNMIYTKYSRPADVTAPSFPEMSILVEGDKREVTLKMKDATEIVFVSTRKSLASPAITLETASIPIIIYLAYINKTEEFTGTEAVNYAIDIALAFGAHWLTVVDAAQVSCPGAKSMFLSTYRALTSSDEDIEASWYGSIAKLRGLTPDRTKYNYLEFDKARKTLAGLKISELKKYIESCKKFVDSDLASKFITYVFYNKNTGKKEGYGKELQRPGFFAFNQPSGKQKLLKRYDEILKIIQGSEDKTLSQFLKEPTRDCVSKIALLDIIPQATINGLPIVFLDKKDRQIFKFPYLKEAENIDAVQRYVQIDMKKRGGRRTIRRIKRNKTRRSRKTN